MCARIYELRHFTFHRRHKIPFAPPPPQTTNSVTNGSAAANAFKRNKFWVRAHFVTNTNDGNVLCINRIFFLFFFLPFLSVHFLILCNSFYFFPSTVQTCARTHAPRSQTPLLFTALQTDKNIVRVANNRF